MPLGQTRTKFNFNLDEKRVLNFENEVSDDDNIKQDMSIDVYGRKDDDPAPTAAAPDAKSEKKPEVNLQLGPLFNPLPLFKSLTSQGWAH